MVSGVSGSGQTSTDVADIVFVNGTVITVDAKFRLAGAVAVRDGRIAAVGSEREIRPFVGERTDVIDLAGGAVLPGINDSHLHGAMLGAYAPYYWMDALAGGGPLPPPRDLVTEEDRVVALRRAWQVLLPLGITSYTEPGLGPGADRQHGGSCGQATLETYRRLAVEDSLPLRVTALALYGELDGPTDLEAYLSGVAELSADDASPDRRFRLAGVKIFADGIPPMRSAWMETPYVGGGTGAMLLPGDDDESRVAALGRMVQAAVARRLQIGVHATGSASISALVDAIVRAEPGGTGDGRHYVIHGDTATPAALARMARHGIGLNTQALIYTSTAAMLESSLGAERTERAFPIADAIDAGVELALSSDSPVLAPDWRRGVVAAVRRRDASGAERGRRQRISVAQAISAYTLAGARQDGAEAWKGSIEVGKVADLCVLEANPLDVDPDEIPQVRVRMTTVDGAVVWTA